VSGSWNNVGDRRDAKTPWPDLIPLDQQTVPPVPIDALPPRMAAYVEAVAIETETPLDAAFALALALLALCAQRRYVVQLRGSHQETLSLWLLLLLNSGERKSAVYRKFFAVVKARQRELRDAGAIDRARAQAALDSVKARLAKVTKDAGTKSGQEAVALACERDEVAEELERLTREFPPTACLLLDDVTPERFASIVADVGAVAIASDEGGVFGTFFGKYNDKAATIDLLLKSHNGGDASVDRQNRDRLEIVEPACTFALAVQPDVMVEMANKREWKERGGPARFQYFMPESQVGRRTGKTEPVPAAVEAGWVDRIRELLPSSPPVQRADRPANAQVMKLDARALAAWETFSAELEPRLDVDAGDLGWTNGWAPKLPGAIARIGALLHLFEHGPTPVSLESMQRALKLAPYFEAHAVAALTMGSAKPGFKDVRQLRRWIETTKPGSFTERDVYHVMFGRDLALAKERAAAACIALEPYGAIRSREPERVDSSAWEVHPEILRVSAVSDMSDGQGNMLLKNLSLSNGMVEPNPTDPTQTTDDERRSSKAREPSSTVVCSETPTLQTLDGEDEPRFARIPDAELDRFAPVTTAQLYSFKHEDGPSNSAVSGALEHNALTPVEVADHHLAEVVDWEAS
jgi:replicative DNA helicase